jgi:hypothetical protein
MELLQMKCIEIAKALKIPLFQPLTPVRHVMSCHDAGDHHGCECKSVSQSATHLPESSTENCFSCPLFFELTGVSTIMYPMLSLD